MMLVLDENNQNIYISRGQKNPLKIPVQPSLFPEIPLSFYYSGNALDQPLSKRKKSHSLIAQMAHGIFGKGMN